MTRPAASSPDVALRMSRQVRADTAPEMGLRRELHRRGFRYRIDYRLDAAGMRRRRADIVFTRQLVAVFVDGCFWHACPEHATSPKANGSWWEEKLAGNVARDRDTDERLRASGWAVVRVWEHEDPVSAADVVAAVLGARPSRTASPPE